MSEHKIDGAGAEEAGQFRPETGVAEKPGIKVEKVEQAAEGAVTPTPAKPAEGKTAAEILEPAASSVAPAASGQAQPKDEVLAEIEEILEEDLGDVYKSLPADKKQEFKVEGEKTAIEIEGVVQKVKIHARKVFGLIVKWLKIIPGVNRFFLEQEAKIKTDEILDLVEEEKNKKINQV